MRIGKYVGLVVVLLFVWLTRPFYHGLAMFFYIYSPIFVPVIVLTAMAAHYGYKKGKIREWSDPIEEAATYGFMTGIITLFIFALTVGMIGNAATYTYIYHHNDYIAVDSLPQMNNETVRAVPMLVAKSLMNKYFVEARYFPDGAQISEVNGSLMWVGQLTPDGFINHYRLKPKGVIMVPMDDMKVSTVTATMKCGKNIGITDNIKWILEKHKYWVNYHEPIPVIEDGIVYYIVPFTAYKFRFYHVVPYWGGVAVVNTETCEVKYLSPEEATKKYSNLPIFPESLAWTYAEAMNYYKDSVIGNWWNVIAKHVNQIELHRYDIGGNGQPFFIKLRDGRGAWFIAAEPYGTGSGIKRIMVITMNGTVYYKDFKTPITGVNAAISAIKNALPRFDWSQFDIVEPIPVEVQGQLYWRFVVVPGGASTIRMIALVPMIDRAVQPSDIKFFESIEEYKAFILGKNYHRPVTQPGEGNETIMGVVKGIWTYNLNGTTHFLVKVSSNNTVLIDVPVSCLSTEEIAEMFSINEGQNVTFTWNDECYVPSD